MVTFERKNGYLLVPEEGFTVLSNQEYTNLKGAFDLFSEYAHDVGDVREYFAGSLDDIPDGVADQMGIDKYWCFLCDTGSSDTLMVGLDMARKAGFDIPEPYSDEWWDGNYEQKKVCASCWYLKDSCCYDCGKSGKQTYLQKPWFMKYEDIQPPFCKSCLNKRDQLNRNRVEKILLEQGWVKTGHSYYILHNPQTKEELSMSDMFRLPFFDADPIYTPKEDNE